MAAPVVTMQQLIEAGAHFGHQTHRWNPRMKPYIFGDRNGVHIIDLSQTVPLFARALEFVSQSVASGGKVLFVGTKRQAQEPVADTKSSARPKSGTVCDRSRMWMPLRSPKMYGFMRGFQRWVWWPKWAPASINWCMLTTGVAIIFLLPVATSGNREPSHGLKGRSGTGYGDSHVEWARL